MHVQQATRKDLPHILKLQKFCFQESAEIYQDYKIQPLIQTLQEVENEYQTSYFFKIVLDNKIVGSVRANIKNNNCHIGKLIVHPDYQNRGIGSNLMNAVEKHFKNVHCFKLYTGKKNIKNIYLYQQLDYKIIREKKINDLLTIIFMKKDNLFL